jgi:nucleoid-associated protein YgaU
LTYEVERGDTLWEIVEQHYGRVDRELVRLVADANPQIAEPSLIQPGWVLTLPDVPDLTPSTVVGEASWTVVRVEEGDTLWDIVDRHYGGATAELVWATVAANPEIVDPDLIYPGQLVTLPPADEGSPPAEPPADVIDQVDDITLDDGNLEPPPATPVELSTPTSTAPRHRR